MAKDERHDAPSETPLTQPEHPRAPRSWGIGGVLLATAAAGAVVGGIAFGVFAFAGPDGGSKEPETVVECVQGRCFERPVSESDAEVVALTAEEEVELLGRAPPTFKEVGRQAGVAFEHNRDREFFNLGGGAAAADFDNDGWLDLYVTNSSGPNALYHNNGDGTFQDIATNAGVAAWTGQSYGAAWGDYDNDGWIDLFVSNFGDSRLYRNNGNLTFTEVTDVAGVVDATPDLRTTGAVWGDYDGDGWLDLLIVRHIDPNGPLFQINTTAQVVLLRECRTEEFIENPEVPRGVVLTDPHDFTRSSRRDFKTYVRPLVLYHNQGDGTFEDVTYLLGSDSVYPNNLVGAGFRPSFFDYDNDGDFDIYVVNDFGEENIPNVLWRNDGPGENGGWRFTDVSAETGANAAMYGMGLAAGDYDNDGDLDIDMTDIGRSRFFENQGGQFVEVTDRTGTGRGVIPENGEVNRSISWGTLFADFDNDGWLDLYTTSGYLDSDPCASHPHQPNSLFVNKGDGTFADVSKSSGANDDGTGRDVVAADFNNDGLLDIFVINVGNLEGDPGIGRFFLNTTEGGNNWLSVSPLTAEGANIAIGARVLVTVDGVTSLRYTGLAQGHTSQSVQPVHFGLGEAGKADVVEIEWPDGTTERLENVDANQALEIARPD